VVEFVRAFSGIGREIDRSLVRCPFDIRAKVQLALSLSIEFDYYLLDRVVLHKDPDFNAQVWEALHERVEAGSSVIVATRQPRSLLKVCDMGIVLSNGDLMIYDDYREAVRAARMTAARTNAARTNAVGRPQTKTARLEGHPA
jgi:capsular polysaccharide transport system ATP-binding protein